jgi:hypothetical protein
LKEAFELHKKYTTFQQVFALDSSEIIHQELSATCSISGTNVSFSGTLYLSPTFICFMATQKYLGQFTLPFYCVMRVERLGSGQSQSTIAITARFPIPFSHTTL